MKLKLIPLDQRKTLVQLDNSITKNKSPSPTPADIILSLLRKRSDGLYTNVFEVATSVTVLKLARSYKVQIRKHG